MEQINTLAKQQEELGQQMSRLHTNLKKDGTSRKTVSHIQTKLTTLSEIWKKCEENHEILQSKYLIMDLTDHAYFTKKYYDQMIAVYENAFKYMQECKIKAEKEEEPRQKSSTIDDKTTRKLKTVINQISDEVQEERSTIRFKILQSKLQEHWEEFKRATASAEFSEDADRVQLFDQLEAAYEDSLEKILMKIEDSSVSLEKTNNINLPQIQLPLFHGGYQEFVTFIDLFEKLINSNRRLSDSEKMNYLKTYVRGDASKLIQHLSITGYNYQTALTILNKRYNNKRLLTFTLIDKILQMKPMMQASTTGLKEIYDTTSECLQGLQNLGIHTEAWGPIIVRMIMQNWDAETKKIYEQNLTDPHTLEGLEDLMEFIQKRFHALENLEGQKSKNHKTSYGPNLKHEQSRILCKYCKGQHWIFTCPEFRSLEPAKRNQAIHEKQICKNCLRHDNSIDCFSKSRCSICNKFHNTLLHLENKINHAEAKKKIKPLKGQVTSNHGYLNQDVLLATAIVNIKKVSGEMEKMRALIDPGSQASFITAHAAQILGLPQQKIKAEVTGLGNNQKQTATAMIETQIQPHFPSSHQMHSTLFILNKLTSTLPQNEIIANLDDWKNHMLADPLYGKPGPIDLIIGAADYTQIVREGIHRANDGLLGQNSELGWLISGTTKRTTQKIEVVSMISTQDRLEKFWEQEEVEENREKTAEENKCEEIYASTTTRDEQGKYKVKIPFKQSPTELGISKARALARFFQLEKRLNRDEQLAKNYRTFMQEYLELGHMRIVSSTEEHLNYYIPHQPVIREESTTTKLRVVFDASCKTTSGVSLNEIMHVGPRLQQELTDILMRWRIHKIAISADIEKMYRQIRIAEEDQKYHRIIWRFHPTQPLNEYELTTVTYGTSAAPYLAVKTLQQLAQDEKEKYPKASEVCKTDFYVDDLLSGANTVKEAKQLQRELIALLQSGGFSLRKWVSNDINLINTLPEKLQDQSATKSFEDATRKAVGIHWTPSKDTFLFQLHELKETSFSKREILSEISKLFDPLGWLAPVIVSAKILMQSLWVKNLNWDEEIPQEQKATWKKIQGQLKAGVNIEIPRWIKFEPGNEIELHGFSDASEKAYGAVIYAKSINGNGEVHTSLLTAKSKVAPLKTKTTIPRLELCAAELLARMLKQTTTALNLENIKIYAWTDSMITLAWINGEPNKWKTFVANRVSKIKNLTPPENWSHVTTKENPADLISRGIEPCKLKECTLWWQGPQWLQTHKSFPNKQTYETNEEVKVNCYTTNLVNNARNNTHQQFSSLQRMARVLSYCRRFKQRCKKEKSSSGPLTYLEISSTILNAIKWMQEEEFHIEITTLKDGKSLEKSNKISNLNPFIDGNGLLRVGGRLQHSALQYEEKHPLILPSKNHLTSLIIKDAHLKTLHGGVQSTLGYLRRQYWVINGKRTTSSMIKKCVPCIRYKAQAAKQLMGSLPEPRTVPSPPFTHTGLDYAGPIQIRTTKGRGHKSYKGYISIFVCLTTKAIHLEVVSDMTTDSFMAAFKRFLARRGTCTNLYSDNGTTFVGASRILTALTEKLSMDGITWHFIPPSAPHFGGLWEAGVKSMKYHLKRIIGDSTLTYEEISTLIYQIEASLNSRPLCPLNDNPEDTMALTPGHFLIGRPLLTPPNIITTMEETNLHNRWRLVQKMKNDFWKQWSKEYLCRLQQRYKWKSPEDNLQVGQVVLIKDDNIAPSKWPLARIKQTHLGADQKARVATLKQATGKDIERPIHKLIPLPIDEEEPTNPKGQLQSRTMKTRKSWKSIIIALLFILQLAKGESNFFKIQYPKPGIYIEHLGYARINRGTFRIELKFEKRQFVDNIKQVHSSINQMEHFCKNATELSNNIQCAELVEQLREKEKEITWLQKDLTRIASHRQKRGLLGEVLTSVFGVNDEIYKDIETLDKNQHELIKASSHQTKFMLQTLATINSTSLSINRRLERFQQKIEEGMAAINQMQKWYRAVDENKLSIHLLSAYNLADHYLNDILRHYQKLTNIHFNTGLFYDLVPPTQIEGIIKAAKLKIPSNIEIMEFPIQKTEIQQSTNFTHVFASFAMTEINEYKLLKITPIPLQVENFTYWFLEVSKTLLAINYNTQLYFEVSESELKESLRMPNHQYILSPNIIYNIDDSPNCVIDQIYERIESNTCPINKQPIHNTIWKQTNSPNTWLFINPKPFRIAITCNGEREDVTLNKTGVISLSQHCIVHTKTILLTPKRFSNIPVIATFSKPVIANLTSISTVKEYKQQQTEAVIKSSDVFQPLREQEQQIQDELGNFNWKTVQHHQIKTNVITGATIVGIIVFVWALYRIIKKCRDKKNATKDKNIGSDAFELQSLRRNS